MNAEEAQEELIDSQDTLEFEDSDFQEPIVLPDESNKRKIGNGEGEEDLEDAEVCDVCQKEWTNNGTHCVTQMKCGHCFGRSCVFLYKREPQSKIAKFNCPVCGQITAQREIRKIWPTKLFPEDDGYINSLKQEIKELDKRLNDLAEQNANVKNKLDERKAVLSSLNPIPGVVSQSLQGNQPVVSTQDRDFSFQSMISVQGELYNAIDLNPLEDMAIVSTFKFSRYGFRKINMYDTSVTEFIPMNHQNIIRDIKHSTTSTILSTGDDKMLKLTSFTNNTVVQSYQLDAPSRACSFSEVDSNLLLCGLITGELMIYDVRNTKSYFSKLVDAERRAPIISVVPKGDSIICTDKHTSYVWALNEAQQEYTTYPLLVSDRQNQNETFYSASVTENTLSSSSINNGIMTHQVNTFDQALNMENKWSFTVNQSTPSICRNTHFSRNDNVYLCYAEKDFVKIRTKNDQVQVFSTKSPIIDIKHTSNGFNEFLATLSQDALYIYKYDI